MKNYRLQHGRDRETFEIDISRRAYRKEFANQANENVICTRLPMACPTAPLAFTKKLPPLHPPPSRASTLSTDGGRPSQAYSAVQVRLCVRCLHSQKGISRIIACRANVLSHIQDQDIQSLCKLQEVVRELEEGLRPQQAASL
jgi:hypothetical protein